MNPSCEAGVLWLQVKVGRHNCLGEFFFFLEYLYIYLSMYLDGCQMFSPPELFFCGSGAQISYPWRIQAIYTYICFIHTFVYTYIFLFLHTYLYTYIIYIYISYIYIYLEINITWIYPPRFFQWLPWRFRLGCPNRPLFFGGVHIIEMISDGLSVKIQTSSIEKKRLRQIGHWGKLDIEYL